jgi:hypothetical protein
MLLPASQYVGASAFAWPAALFLWGPGSWTDMHRHHCVQLVMALDGTLHFRQRQRQRWTSSGAVLVRPDAWHEVNARETEVLIPSSTQTASLVRRWPLVRHRTWHRFRRRQLPNGADSWGKPSR